MMTPAGGGGGGEHAHHGGEAEAAAEPEFQKQLGAVVKDYLKVQEALAADDHSAAAGSAKQALEALDKMNMGLVDGDAHLAWMKSAGELKSLLLAVADAGDIAAARAKFALLSEEMAAVLARFGVAEGTLFKAWCPMAFDNRGASWIQRGEEINNPYFGETMLRCGEIKEVLK